MQNIIDNYLNKESFIHALHENKIFSTEKFNLLLKAIVIEATSEKTESDKNELNYILFMLYKHTSQHLIAHFSSDDLFVINDLDDDYDIYLNRLEFLIESIISNRINQINDYCDELGGFHDL